MGAGATSQHLRLSLESGDPLNLPEESQVALVAGLGVTVSPDG